MKPRVSIIIPVRNEETHIAHVLDEAMEVFDAFASTYEIVINEDASSDSTRSILDAYQKKSKNIQIFYQKKPLGIALGVEYLYTKVRYDYICIHSGDGQYTAKDFPTMIQKAEEGFDIVVGRRTHKKYSVWRTCVSELFNTFPRLLFGVNTYDAGSIKVYKKPVIQKIIPISHGVFNEAERIIRASRAGYSVCVMPAHHYKRTSGSETGAKWSLIIQACADMIVLWYFLILKRVSPLNMR